MCWRGKKEKEEGREGGVLMEEEIKEGRKEGRKVVVS